MEEKPMTEIVALLQSIAPLVSKATLRQMSQVIEAMLSMTERITMLGLSRWTEDGGSYRTIQRWYRHPLDWLQIRWVFFRRQLGKVDHEYIVAGDKVVLGKAGKETYGLGRFFSSLQNRVILGLCFFVFSLVDVQKQQSYPLQVAQIVRMEGGVKKKKEMLQKVEKRAKGLPKGSRNKKSEEPTMNPKLLLIQTILQAFLNVLDVALYQPFTGQYRGLGPHPKY
jgi:putative transposase